MSAEETEETEGTEEALSQSDEAQHEERLVEGRRLTERVEEFIQQGKHSQARSILARSWQDAVPDLPLRYPVVLENLPVRFVRQLANFLRAGGPPPSLEVELAGSRTLRGLVTVSGRRLGDLSAEQAEFLHGLGEDAALYEPQLRAIRVGSSGEVEGVEIEMVRPELRRCSSCGRLHADDHVNCAECRGKRRRKDPDKAETEAPPVALQEAIDAVSVEDSPRSS